MHKVERETIARRVDARSELIIRPELQPYRLFVSDRNDFILGELRLDGDIDRIEQAVKFSPVEPRKGRFDRFCQIGDQFLRALRPRCAALSVGHDLPAALHR